jgi:hypothetical protein
MRNLGGASRRKKMLLQYFLYLRIYFSWGRATEMEMEKYKIEMFYERVFGWCEDQK